AGAVDADAEVGGVEGAGPAPVDAGDPAGQLRHEPARVASLGQEMTMAAVVAQHHVVGAQRRAYAGRHRLLPDAGMYAAHDLAGTDKLDRALLEPADQLDGAVQLLGRR